MTEDTRGQEKTANSQTLPSNIICCFCYSIGHKLNSPHLTIAMMTSVGRLPTTNTQSIIDGPTATRPQPTTSAIPMAPQAPSSLGLVWCGVVVA